MHQPAFSHENINEKLQYGNYSVPCTFEQEGLIISVLQEGENLLYHRDGAGETVDKAILTAKGSITLNPVEPVNKPKEITSFFLVEFEQRLFVKPREESEVLVTFPVEIASIFMDGNDGFTVLDIFSLADQKYTLYGTPKSGFICRYWKSSVHLAEHPTPDPLKAGIMRLFIRNTTPRWLEITKAVFNTNDMKIYYNHEMVYTEAYMKIQNETTAETGFSSSMPGDMMDKSIELRSSKKAIMSGTKFLMEEGL